MNVRKQGLSPRKSKNSGRAAKKNQENFYSSQSVRPSELVLRNDDQTRRSNQAKKKELQKRLTKNRPNSTHHEKSGNALDNHLHAYSYLTRRSLKKSNT